MNPALTRQADPLSPAELDGLRELAIEVATACGRWIVDERPADLGVDHTKASATDAVTVMDAGSEELAARLLRQARPDDGLFGEEGLSQPGTTGITWVVDPIDGTVNYLYRIPAYAVSVAAVVGDPSRDDAWLPVAGAVCNPETGEVFAARRGGGATVARGGAVRRLEIDPAESLAQSLVATGFAYEAELRAAQGRVVAELLPQVRDIRRLGSAALDLCHVADGALDAYYEHWLKPWDYAAGALVAAEAGATVTTTPVSGLGRRLTVAGSAGIVAELTPLVQLPTP